MSEQDGERNDSKKESHKSGKGSGKLPPLLCHNCDTNLRGSQYVEKDSNKYCIPCHEKLFCHTCCVCDQVIGVGQRGLSYGEQHYHTQCFQCHICKSSVAEDDFDTKEGIRYCEKCLVEKFGPEINKCPKCGDKLKRGQKKMQYRDQHFHEKCFRCVECDKQIGTESFYPRPEGNTCKSCYEAIKARKKAEAEANKN